MYNIYSVDTYILHKYLLFDTTYVIMIKVNKVNKIVYMNIIQILPIDKLKSGLGLE